MNNEVRDWRGNIIGFRCHVCDHIKTKMWGDICNECRERRELTAELASALRAAQKGEQR